MGRPSKLSPEQWAEIERRLIGGEGVRALASEYGISPGQVSKRFPNSVSKSVHAVAEKLAEAQTALAALPVTHQNLAMSLADKLRNISVSVASAAELGAMTGHRLHALANSEVGKVDDADPLSDESLSALKGVGVLTKLANESLAPALNLLAANKERVQRMDDPEDKDKPAGVLVVPGLMADAGAWSQAAQAGSKGE